LPSLGPIVVRQAFPLRMLVDVHLLAEPRRRGSLVVAWPSTVVTIVARVTPIGAIRLRE
jgi:hypothetical protein